MTALSDALQKPNNQKVVLAEITAGKFQPVWEEAWSPYQHSDLAFSVWAEDIEQEDGSEVISVRDGISGLLLTNRAEVSKATLVKADSTINGRKSVKMSATNYFQSIQPVVSSAYYSETAFTWVFLFKKPVAKTTIWPARADLDAYMRMTDSDISDIAIQHGEYVELDPGSIDDGAWHIWRAVRDGDDFSLYIDGVLADSETVTSAASLDVSVSRFMLAFFGNYGLGDSGDCYFAGSFLFKTAIDATGFESGLNSFYALGDSGPSAEKLWTTPEINSVSAVKINGTALTLATSVSNCLATASSWYWDSKRVYINSTSDPSDWDNTTILFILFRFSTESKDLNGVYYDGRLKGIPALTAMVEEDFEGVAHLGGGSVVLANGDRLFDALKGYRWDAGTTSIFLGVDTRFSDMAYADYQLLGKWNNDSWKVSNDFELNVLEFRERLDKEIPFAVYGRSEFANLHESHAGKSKQIVYGHVYGASAVCIDIYTKTFQVAGHAISSIERARVEKDDVIRQITITSIDLTNARFVYSDWDGQAEVTVDLFGKVDDNGDLIDNAADMVEDILLTCGITDVNAASFLAAHDILDRGYYQTGKKRISSFAPFVYVGEPDSALDIISVISSTVGAYMYVNASGEYCFKVFEPDRVEGLETFKEDEIASLEVEVETEDLLSYLHVKYAERKDEGWSVDYTIEKTRNQHFRNESSRVKEERDVQVSDLENAALYANKAMIYSGNVNLLYKIEFVCPRAVLLTQAQQFHLQFEIKSDGSYQHDKVLEIYSVSFDPTNMDKVSVIAGNRHGYDDDPGYWVGDSETLPLRFASLAGYGDGSISWRKDWHPLIKAWARQNYGYWTDDNGLADSSDPESYIPSILV